MKYTFRTKPYPHQRKALKRLLRQRGGGLQVPMRWGKTKLAIDFASCLAMREGIQRVLVICPISVMGVWEEEIRAHQPRNVKLRWRIVNYEQTYSRHYHHGRQWYPVPNKKLERFGADLVIVDESHNIGNPTAQVSKQAYRLGQRARFRLFMTGTMFHRKPFFVFGQAKFYDPALFGTSFSGFKQMIAVMGGYGGYEVLRYQNLRWMMDRMRSVTHIEKYVPPRNTAHNALYFHLTGKGLAAYAKMEADSVITVGDEHVVSPIVLSRHLRCQQIAGGWVKTPTRYRRVGDDKFRMACDRFQQYADGDIDKVVVGCRFIPELRDAATAAARAGYDVILFHGNLTAEQRTTRRRRFQSTKRPTAFIAQINTAKEGINLSAASVMLFYSLSESYVAHDQFSRRIEKYKDDRVLQYDYLVARGTRDEVTYEAIKLKKDVADFLVQDPDKVEEITAHKKSQPTGK